ncbi:MAG: hypothetical protein F6K09_29800, partial [Merismopedia sp. SIO2A8]|nr:hypothetical protein [Merismopedia sp. SIO2A8]
MVKIDNKVDPTNAQFPNQHDYATNLLQQVDTFLSQLAELGVERSQQLENDLQQNHQDRVVEVADLLTTFGIEQEMRSQQVQNVSKQVQADLLQYQAERLAMGQQLKANFQQHRTHRTAALRTIFEDLAIFRHELQQFCDGLRQQQQDQNRASTSTSAPLNMAKRAAMPRTVDRAKAGELATAKAKAEQLEQDHIKVKQMAAQKLAAVKAEKERLVAEKIAAEKLVAEQLAAIKAKTEQLVGNAAEIERQAEQDIALKVKTAQAEVEQLATEKAEAEKLAAEQLAQAQSEVEKLATEKADAEKLAAEQLAQAQAEAEKLATE